MVDFGMAASPSSGCVGYAGPHTPRTNYYAELIANCQLFSFHHSGTIATVVATPKSELSRNFCIATMKRRAFPFVANLYASFRR
ncbi:hypothetical protein LCGC14_1140940 [marine sediment metagenome]|uniref:Uncharacterized protein n=1 Tax=marine sediment metagenome TaxID=412755 RepID=A0A0F9LY93_9ZZZZ